MKYILHLILTLFVLQLSISTAHALCAGCDNDNFMNELIRLESGNDYGAESGTLPSTSTHAGATAMGRYQIMHREAIDWGCIPTRTPGTGQGTVLTSAERQSFLADTGRQDACLATGIAEKYSILEANGLANGGGGYDCGALLGTAWLGDPVKVANGSCVADALSTTYTTCDRADQMQGVCGGGTAGVSDKPYPGRAALIGCDPAVLEKGKEIVDAMNESDMQIAKSMITQPTPIEQTTCADQHIQRMSGTGGIMSNPAAGNISASLGPLVEQPFIQNLTSNFMAGNPLGSLQSMINNSYGKVVEEFNTMMSGLSGGLLGGLGGGGSGGAGASGGCDMMNESWLLAQCIQMPKFPSVNDILGGALNDVTGGLTDMINSPFKALDKVCEGMSDKLGDYTNSLTDSINDSVGSLTSPITDMASDISNIGN
jgi:hypothetical protein